MNSWSYVAASGGITDTNAVTIKAAAGATLRNYVTGIQMFNSGAAGTEVLLRDGAGGSVLWRGYVAATSAAFAVWFPNGAIKSTANTLLEVVLSSGTTVAVRFNAQGYVDV